MHLYCAIICIWETNICYSNRDIFKLCIYITQIRPQSGKSFRGTPLVSGIQNAERDANYNHTRIYHRQDDLKPPTLRRLTAVSDKRAAVFSGFIYLVCSKSIASTSPDVLNQLHRHSNNKTRQHRQSPGVGPAVVSPASSRGHFPPSSPEYSIFCPSGLVPTCLRQTSRGVIACQVLSCETFFFFFPSSPATHLTRKHIFTHTNLKLQAI